MTLTENEFWDYSLKLYDSPGVAERCLILQNDYGLDVNVVLFCVWFGYRSGQLPGVLLDEVLAFSTDWRESVVQPLRNVRTSMKDNAGPAAGMSASKFGNLRESIKRIELQAEKLQQDELRRLAAPYLPSESTEANPQASLLNLTLLADRLLCADANSVSCHMQALVSASEDLS